MPDTIDESVTPTSPEMTWGGVRSLSDLGDRIVGFAFWEAVRTTLAEVAGHKLRSALTLIGVVFGTFAVVFMVTLIEGVKIMVWDGIRGLGFDGVMFVSSQPPEDRLELRKRTYSRGLQAPDAGMLVRDSELLEAVAAVRVSEQIVAARGEQLRIQVYGITPSYGIVHDRHVSAGRWLQDSDQFEARKVAVLGGDLAEKLFGTDDPIGKPIRIGDAAFRIVGVEKRLANRFVNSGWVRREMNGVLVPLSAFRSYLQGGQGLSVLTVKTANKDRLDLVRAEVERLMRRAHHGIGDFHIENIADEMLRAEKEITVQLRNWTIVLASIAGISLLVGGVGIYSVMRISLVERLYEIGLRKAMGGTDRAILTQFLVESATLSVIGALFGCVLALVVTALLSGQFEAGLPMSPVGLLMGISFAIATGLFAGVFPAVSASRLTPVEALRG